MYGIFLNFTCKKVIIYIITDITMVKYLHFYFSTCYFFANYIKIVALIVFFISSNMLSEMASDYLAYRQQFQWTSKSDLCPPSVKSKPATDSIAARDGYEIG